MGRIAKPLPALTISRLVKPGLHFVGHVSGLALNVSTTGAKSWILRATIGGKRRDIGLGAFPGVSLALAKEYAIQKRKMVEDGIDPIAARKAATTALKKAGDNFMTLKEAGTKYIDVHRAGWKNAKHIAQWTSTLENYVYPVAGHIGVADLDVDHMLAILEPIWNEKRETASRIRGRVEVILDWTKARRLRTGENPAAWKGNLAKLLPARNKSGSVKHHEAMDADDLPSFMKLLNEMDTEGTRALELCVLTAARSGEIRNARWKEFDLKRGVWTVPAERMKAGKEHRIPLSEGVLVILSKIERYSDNDYLFTNTRGKPLSDMALTMILRRLNLTCTVHGFRSTFRDWAGETTNFSREVIEHALAHQLKDKAEAAYARGDLFDKRKQLMDAWTKFCKPKRKPKSKN